MTSSNPARDEVAAVDTAAEMRHYMQTGEKVPAEVIGRWRALINKCEALSAAKPPASGVDAVAGGVDLVAAINHAESELSQHIEKYHDYEDDTPERASLRDIQHHLMGSLIADDGEFLSPAAPSGLSTSTQRICEECGLPMQWCSDKAALKMADATIERLYAKIASLSPAATPVSEAGGELEAEQPDAQRYGAEFPGEPTTVGDLFKPALAKPASSPAGGDVREAEILNRAADIVENLPWHNAETIARRMRAAADDHKDIGHG